MKRKNGFTLIEIIGAIVILGIIAVIAFSTYTRSLRGFREDYYENLIRTTESSGSDFFNDNRNYRPNQVLEADKVTLATLMTKNYISDIKDYNGDSCSETSYVLVVKEGKNNYTYHSCLTCEKDNYSNVESEYCDSSWLDPTKITYTLGEIEPVYVYLGSTKQELKERLTLPVSYQRTLTNGKVIERRGTGEGEPTILPNNIDIVNTNVEGEYTVEYEYKTEKKTRKVVVYQNVSPSISYQKEQTRATKIEGSTTTEKKTETYTSGTWAQNVIVHLSSNAFTESGVTAAKFQWNKDGVWKDFCTSDPCDVKIETEMNQTVQFRMIDSNGKISKTTDQITIKIDNTKPKCTIINDTAIAENNWYNTNVKIKFTEKEDQNTNNVISGIKKYNIYQSGSNIPSDRNIGTINEITHSTDTAGITYYGIIEDEAENYNTCGPVTFKRDATKPVCSVTGHATVGCTDSLSKVNRWYYSKTNTSSGTYDTVTLTNNLSVNATNKVGSSGTYYLYAKDEAGNISDVKSYTYYDVTYNKNNGTTNPTKASDIIRNGNNADLTPTATKDGHSFVGWNTNNGATTKLSSYKVTGTTILYAIYAICPAGTYSKGSLTCSNCIGRTKYSGAGASSCTTVSGGYYSTGCNSSNNNCTGQTQCPKSTASVAGYFCSNGVQTICPNGKYAANAGATSCSNCPSGSACSGGKIVACGPGKYSTGSASSCSVCRAGTYSNGSVNTGCTSCVTGSYSGAGSSRCTACTGNTTSGSGSSSCNANCSNRANVASWNTATWNTNNTVSNNCSIRSCPTGYTLSSNKCNVNYYYLDLNGWLDGASNGGISGYGTCDVYINGSRVADDKDDYYQQHPYGTTYEFKDCKATTGHTYNGVYSGSASGTIGAGNTATYFNFTTNRYTVSFNCNGGSTPPSAQTGTYGKPFTLTSSTCSRSGYSQKGWNEKSDGTGTSWTTSNTNNWTWNYTSNVTLYAVWEKDDCWNTIYWCQRGGSCSGSGCYTTTRNENSCFNGGSQDVWLEDCHCPC